MPGDSPRKMAAEAPEVPARHRRSDSGPGSAQAQDQSRFREMELLCEAGLNFGRQVRNVRRVAVADNSFVKQLSPPSRKTVEDIEEGLFQVQRMHSHVMAKTTSLVYRLQDVLLQEECSRLRKQMQRISTLPAERRTAQLREREHDLIVRIVRNVNKRDAILADLHTEQLRAADEQRLMDREYQRWRRGFPDKTFGDKTDALYKQGPSNGDEQTTANGVDEPFPDWTRTLHTPPPKKQNKTSSALRNIRKRLLKTVSRVTSKRKNK
ncbi:uncharacterized protein LOC8036862 isoform X1 [Ixodes scapularis]|uniref:uncharacterized protein LOC8036862 isoform X1 n=1 Tax=Ixodes scapularis TaxID=6945 RepID=UPI001161B49F|nr:uncharacterized protein LOC8036862 isoform X1 [Ixodes scapularis]